MQDLIGRQFDYFCTISGSAAGPLQQHLVKGIAAFRRERLPSLLNVPTAYEQGQTVNVLASAAVLQNLAQEQPERTAKLRERIAAGTAEGTATTGLIAVLSKLMMIAFRSARTAACAHGSCARRCSCGSSSRCISSAGSRK